MKHLNRRGYEATTVHYPTIGYNTSGTTYDDEVKSVQYTVAEYVENQHKDVVLFCHSYGGWPGSRAVKGWDKATREQHGLQNGIIELVFLAAFLLPDNAPTAVYSALPDWITNKVKLLFGKYLPKAFLNGVLELQRRIYSSD